MSVMPKELPEVTPEEQKIDELIRDITKVGFMPKSEARRRIMELLSSTKKQKDEELLMVYQCLNKIKLAERKRMDEAAGRQEVYDASVSSWATTAQKILDSLLNQSEEK